MTTEYHTNTNCTNGCGLILGGTDVLLLILSGVVVVGEGMDLLWSFPRLEGTVGCAGEAGCCCCG